eukprot:m.115667 g.115667  ORF g.115667 m.115667 type:complete len:265 (-) comp28439_c0_seq1:285-1079(-)
MVFTKSCLKACLVVSGLLLFANSERASASSKVRSENTPVVESGSLDQFGGAEKKEDAEKTAAKVLEAYLIQFKHKRKDQVLAAESLVSRGDYAAQYKLTKVLLDEVFKTLRQAEINLTDVDLDELPALPVKHNAVFESLVNVWESTALFGDICLRLPDITHRMINNHKLRLRLIAWAVAMCRKTPVYNDVQTKQLDLIMQETKLADVVDENYENPFSEAVIRKNQNEMLEMRALQEAEISRIKKRKQRGPMLSVIRKTKFWNDL